MRPLFFHSAGDVLTSDGTRLHPDVLNQIIVTVMRKKRAAEKDGEIERRQFYATALRDLSIACEARGKWARASGCVGYRRTA